MLGFLAPTNMLGYLLDKTAVIKRIPAGTDPDARQTIVVSLQSSAPQIVRDEMVRARMATIEKPYRCLVARNTDIKVDDIYVFSDLEYRIREIAEWPDDGSDTKFYELHIEKVTS